MITCVVSVIFIGIRISCAESRMHINAFYMKILIFSLEPLSAQSSRLTWFIYLQYLIINYCYYVRCVASFFYLHLFRAPVLYLDLRPKKHACLYFSKLLNRNVKTTTFMQIINTYIFSLFSLADFHIVRGKTITLRQVPTPEKILHKYTFVNCIDNRYLLGTYRYQHIN